MARSAALIFLPSCQPLVKEKDLVETAAPLLMQSLEDLRLAERIDRALGATGHAPLCGIKVTVHARLVILEGCVPSYYLKQMAQTIALAVPGVHQVRNDLEVGNPS